MFFLKLRINCYASLIAELGCLKCYELGINPEAAYVVRCWLIYRGQFLIIALLNLLKTWNSHDLVISHVLLGLFFENFQSDRCMKIRQSHFLPVPLLHKRKVWYVRTIRTTVSSIPSHRLHELQCCNQCSCASMVVDSTWWFSSCRAMHVRRLDASLIAAWRF